jgi:hypothetical protein
MSFAAVEIKEGETAHMTVKTVLDAAQAKQCRLSTLELLGILTLGRMKFIRFRTESKTLATVLTTLDRGVVLQGPGGYRLRFPGDTGPGVAVSISSMASVGEPGIKRTYRGPGVQYWERQFI